MVEMEEEFVSMNDNLEFLITENFLVFNNFWRGLGVDHLIDGEKC